MRKKYFVRAATSSGCVNLAESNFSGFEKSYVLKGNSKTVKTRIISAVGTYFEQKGLAVETVLSPFGPYLDGVTVPGIGLAVSDGEVYSGDGVILCTPTGSTAYSMSAGGPIVEPSAKNFLITPICAHAMLAKSIVVAPSRVVTVKVGKVGRHNAFLSVDGGRAFRLNVGDEIVVRSSQKVTRLVRLKNTSFFEILNRKFIEKMR